MKDEKWHGSQIYLLSHFVQSPFASYLMSIPAAWASELTTFPVDVTKTRMQIHGEGIAKDVFQKKGMFATMMDVVRKEGVFKLWAGIQTALAKHVVYSGVRLCSFQYLRDSSVNYLQRPLPIYMTGLCGIASGITASCLASPFDLVKTRLQMEGQRRLMGEAPRVHGMLHAFRDIVSTAGYKGLWAGALANMQRAALVNLGDLTTYDVSKKLFIGKLKMKDNWVVHVLSSLCSGLVGATLATPSDVVKARMMNQPTDQFGRGLLYSGTMDCFIKTLNVEGFNGIYKGFIPLWLRLGPWALVFWVSFEQIRSFVGASGF